MMKKLTILSLFCLMFLNSQAQIDTLNQRKVSMTQTYQKAYKMGSVYYEIGTNKPFTGILYGTYANGQYMSMQEYVDGVGNGKWIDFDPLGRKVCEGTYKDNRVEGPVKFFYENGNLKSEGQYLHWKQPIGLWKYYDEDGNLVHTMRFTR